MLSTVMIEDALGKSPILVTAILIPYQPFGIWLPVIAGNTHDNYSPKLLRIFCMPSIALWFVLLAVFAAKVSFWLVHCCCCPQSTGDSLRVCSRMPEI